MIVLLSLAAVRLEAATEKTALGLRHNGAVEQKRRCKDAAVSARAARKTVASCNFRQSLAFDIAGVDHDCMCQTMMMFLRDWGQDLPRCQVLNPWRISGTVRVS